MDDELDALIMARVKKRFPDAVNAGTNGTVVWPIFECMVPTPDKAPGSSRRHPRREK